MFYLLYFIGSYDISEMRKIGGKYRLDFNSTTVLQMLNLSLPVWHISMKTIW